LIKPWLIRRAAQHQLGNLRNLLAGEPVTVAPLGGMNLDRDDVDIARRWLKDRHDWFDRGPVEQYQAEFARWNGSRHAFAVMGGRVALSACLHALNLAPGDEVILPGYTCVVVPNALKYAGLTPVYCDIELETYGLDAGVVEATITPRTRAIILHHLYGLVCRDYEAILKLAARHGLAVIEDCAHATGAEYRGTKVGNRGTVAFYSSEQTKVFNTVQGGVAVTNDDALAERMRQYWERAPYPTEGHVQKLLQNVLLQYYGFKHRQRWWLGDLMDLIYGESRFVSTTPEELQGLQPDDYGCRMPAPIAALGLNQMRKLDRYNAQRRETARRWDAWCREQGYQSATVVPSSLPVFLRYPVMVESERKQDRAWARNELRVDLGVWFRGSVHPLEGFLPECPRAAQAVASCVNFPCLLS